MGSSSGPVCAHELELGRVNIESSNQGNTGAWNVFSNTPSRRNRARSPGVCGLRHSARSRSWSPWRRRPALLSQGHYCIQLRRNISRMTEDIDCKHRYSMRRPKHDLSNTDRVTVSRALTRWRRDLPLPPQGRTGFAAGPCGLSLSCASARSLREWKAPK